MRYLNLGCGLHYSIEKEWTNLDFVSSSENVAAHNLLKGIPFDDNTYDLVYHSHVLEHFSRLNGSKFIKECYRVLRPGGVLRIAVPDLEQISRNYIKFLEMGLSQPYDPLIRANYNWMVLEMYDQTVRNVSGGEMAKYLSQEKLINEEFVFERWGDEGKAIRNNYINPSQNSKNGSLKRRSFISLFSEIKRKITISTLDFRKRGEIHLWMYDKYSMTTLLLDHGFHNISFFSAFDSSIPAWKKYELDGKDGITRKPDSLFTEASK